MTGSHVLTSLPSPMVVVVAPRRDGEQPRASEPRPQRAPRTFSSQAVLRSTTSTADKFRPPCMLVSIPNPHYHQQQPNLLPHATSPRPTQYPGRVVGTWWQSARFKLTSTRPPAGGGEMTQTRRAQLFLPPRGRPAGARSSAAFTHGNRGVCITECFSNRCALSIAFPARAPSDSDAAARRKTPPIQHLRDPAYHVRVASPRRRTAHRHPVDTL